MSAGRIHQINLSKGGVPKRAEESARVTAAGLAGDGHAKPDIHGGPHQAVSLFSLERIEALAAAGHPIAPGSTGENVTIEGLDWSRLEPGMRLRLGEEVLLELTGYAAPCRTIAGSFSDGRFARLSQLRAPGWSRLYAQVLTEGSIQRGDPVSMADGAGASRATERAAPRLVTTAPTGGTSMQVSYVNVYVTNLERSVAFYEKTLGLALQFAHTEFGYASFDAGPVRIGLARIDPEDPDSRSLAGRQTGIGFGVPDLVAKHAELEGRGVRFPMKPAKQPWGGFMALFADPDENVFYLDELPDA